MKRLYYVIICLTMVYVYTYTILNDKSLKGGLKIKDNEELVITPIKKKKKKASV